MDVIFTEVDGPLAWREAGPPDGPVVVLLHGLGGSRTAWDPQLEALGSRWRAVAWDMPGYGASAPLVPLTFPALADAVLGLLDTLGAPAAHLVGLSMGGMVALHCALAHPSRVRSLALLDTSPAFGFDGTTDAGAWKRLRLDPLDAGVTPAAMAPGVIASIVAPGTRATVVAAGAAPMARISPAALRAAVECLPSHDLRGRLGAITAPALVAVGELDLETPPAYSEYLAAELGGPTALRVLAGAGHLPPLETPDAVNRLLVDFLAPQEAA